MQFDGMEGGWIGERSVPRTRAEGCSRASEVAQRPVPVAMSRTLCRCFTGAEKRAPFMVWRKRWCCRSGAVRWLEKRGENIPRRSCSASSFGTW